MSEKSHKLSYLLMSQPLLKVLAAIFEISVPIGIRELSNITGVSIGGVQDVIKRLRVLEIIEEKKVKNKRTFKLTLEEREKVILEEIIKLSREREIKLKALELSKKAPSIIKWHEETLEEFSQSFRKNISNL